MIRQRLKRFDSVVPGRGSFRFTVPETGYRIENEHTMNGLLARVEQHYEDNNIHLPKDWKESVENQLCLQLPEGWCEYTDGTPARGSVPILSAENLIKGVTSLATMVASAVKGDDVFVSQEEANRRAEICARCYQNINAGFCTSCGAMQQLTNLVAKVRGSRKTPSDKNLQNCGICGCRNEAIVHVNRKVLLSGEKSETTQARPDWCWVKTEDLNKAKSEQHL